MSIGHRPVRVVGYELPDFGRSGTLPIFKGAGGLQMVTLDNGAVCRGLHGNLRREGARNYNYLYYGDSGMMESGRFDNSHWSTSTMKVKNIAKGRGSNSIQNPV